MIHKASAVFFRNHQAARRTFATYATQASAGSHMNFSRADLAEYPELDRSFMRVLDSGVDTQSADYLDNYKQMMLQNEELDRITQNAMHVDKDYREKAIKRDKLMPRERINAILDHGTPFLELGQLAGYNSLKPEQSVPSGNIITGIGMVNGR